MKIKTGATRRQERTRNAIKRVSDRLRISVFRSNRYIYAQIIDDKAGKTILGVTEKEITAKAKNGIEKASLLGKVLAEKALKKDIKKVVFEKGPYKYHGRIKALADGAREGGLDF